MSKARRSKGRRAYLKRFSGAMVNNGTGPTPNRSVLAGYHHRASSVGVGGTDRVPDKIVSKEETKEEELESLWQGDFWQGIETFNKIALFKGRFCEIYLHFHGLRWVFTYKDKLIKRRKRSIIYSDRDRAMRAYERGRIHWYQYDTEAPPG